MQYKIKWLLTVEYIYAALWEYVLIIKVWFWHLSEYWVQSYICCDAFSWFIWSNLQNLRDVLIVVRLSEVMSTYKSAELFGLCSNVLLIAVDEILNVCSSCF